MVMIVDISSWAKGNNVVTWTQGIPGFVPHGAGTLRYCPSYPSFLWQTPPVPRNPSRKSILYSEIPKEIPLSKKSKKSIHEPIGLSEGNRIANHQMVLHRRPPKLPSSLGPHDRCLPWFGAFSFLLVHYILLKQANIPNVLSNSMFTPRFCLTHLS